MMPDDERARLHGWLRDRGAEHHPERSDPERHIVVRDLNALWVYDGDRPADLTGTDSVSLPEYRNWYREPDQRALTMREWSLARKRRGDGLAAGVRETHREVHRALAGETTGATIAGCPFCAESK